MSTTTTRSVLQEPDHQGKDVVAVLSTNSLNPLKCVCDLHALILHRHSLLTHDVDVRVSVLQ